MQIRGPCDTPVHRVSLASRQHNVRTVDKVQESPPLYLLGPGCSGTEAPRGLERSQGMDEDTKPDRCIPEFSSGDIERAHAGLPAPASLDTCLSIPRQIWESTLSELRLRSAGWRESAAILCGRVIGSEWIVEIVRFHHHLCDDRGRPLSIRLTESAKYGLYTELNRLGLRLIAGIHTHPEDWVDLSWIDQQNQLCSRTGFWSIVVPWYAEQSWQLDGIGIHIRTRDGWCRLTTEQTRKYVQITE